MHIKRRVNFVSHIYFYNLKFELQVLDHTKHMITKFSYNGVMNISQSMYLSHFFQNIFQT